MKKENFNLNLNENERVALFVLSVLSIPINYDQISSSSWSNRFLYLLKEQLNIQDDYYNAYKYIYPLSYQNISSNSSSSSSSTSFSSSSSSSSLTTTTNNNNSSLNTSNEINEIFLNNLRNEKTNMFLVLSKLTILLILNGFYDSRGRSLIRNLKNSLMISDNEYVSLESFLSCVFQDIEDKITRSNKTNENDSKLLKYAKIGAVGLGAGALLAFTGGLAAPAVAAAFLVMGGSTFVAAGLTSAAALASLFGTAGAGLAGYKMVILNIR